MKTWKRVISVLLSVVLLLGLVPASAVGVDAGTPQEPVQTLANESEAEPDTDGGEITRAQWLQSLVKTFDMTVEDEIYPDNYFSDLKSTSAYYYDMLLAVEFGVVDIAAGEALHPDDLATREFAAQTLNFCLGYQPEEGAEYTFAEADTVTYKDDIQVALNRGWFALVDGAFLPEQPITAAESEKMLADAASALASTVVDENYQSVYEFTADVIVIPDGTEVTVDSEAGIVTIKNCPEAIADGDLFAVYCNGIPSAYKAVSVDVTNGVTTVAAQAIESGKAFKDIDAQGAVTADITDFEAVDGTTIVWRDEGTDQTFYNAKAARAAYQARGTARPDETLYANKKLNFGNMYVEINAKLKNPVIYYDFSLKEKRAYVKMVMDAEISFSGGMKFTGDIPLVKVGVAGVGGLTVKVKAGVSGEITAVQEGKITAGVQYSESDGFRLIKEFTAKSFTLTLKVNGSIALVAELGVTDLPVIKAYLYAEVGGIVNIKTEIFTDGKLPKSCTDYLAYIYAKYGATVKVDFGILGKHEKKFDQPIFDQNNSPVRVYYHYEDGKQVAKCSRGGSGGYYTPANSAYGGSGLGVGGSTVPTYNYSLDSDKNLTITKYNGSATALAIPDTIDGYTVVGIGIDAFKNNTKLRSVIIPDTVKKIGSDAFVLCSNLSTVKLSKNLEEMGSYTFGLCPALTAIEIPKSLKKADFRYSYSGYGGSFGESGLKSVIFEPGTTSVCKGLFYGARELQNVQWVDSIITIEDYSFTGCSALREIKLPEYVTKIGRSAFAGCNSVTELNLPEDVTTIGSSAFSGISITELNLPGHVVFLDDTAFSSCKNLQKVQLPKSLETLGSYAFGYCSALTEIEIPKSIKNAGKVYYPGSGAVYGGPFAHSGLKNVTFEPGTAAVVSNLFYEADNLQNVQWADSITAIGDSAFANCSALTELKLPDHVTTIGQYAFADCETFAELALSKELISIGKGAFQNNVSLHSVIMPDTVTKIEDDAFRACGNLSNVKLSKHLETIGRYVFGECLALNEIEIPKSLKTAEAIYGNGYAQTYYSRYGGPFDGSGLKSVTFEPGTTGVCANLFCGAKNLQDVQWADSITTIGNGSFENCSSLAELKLPTNTVTIGDGAFCGCTSLTEAILPGYITTIGDCAFYGCKNLSTVKLPKKLQSLGMWAFSGGTALTKIEIPKSLKNAETAYSWNTGPFVSSGLTTATFEPGTTGVCANLFRGVSTLREVTLIDGMTEIGAYAFERCTSLADIKLPEGLKKIGDYAFSGSGLQEVAIPNTVDVMGNYVFSDCANLTKAVLSDIPTDITKGIFQNCTSLKELTLPEVVTAIRAYAFQNCTALEKLNIPAGLTMIEESAFNGSGLKQIALPDGLKAIEKEAFRNSGLTSVKVPNSCATIGDSAFRDCLMLTSAHLADGVTTLGTYVFDTCPLLTDVRLGTGIRRIPDYTFSNCEKLVELVVPYRVTSIGGSAFLNDVAFKNITIPRATTSIAANAFSYPSKMTIYGVAGTYAETYANEKEIDFVNNETNATNVTLTPDVLNINRGVTTKLAMTVTPANFTDEVFWKSSNTSVVTIDDTGTVKAVGLGTATIKLVVGNVSASCKVTVVQPVTSISLNKTSLTLEALVTSQLTAQVNPVTANIKDIIWSSSDEKIAAVDQNGLVTPYAKGVATITATAADGSGTTASCTVTVTNTAFVAQSGKDLESPHNYPDNCTDFWVYTAPSAKTMALTFDERTEIEDGFDYLCIYDAGGNQIGRYTGTELAGQTVEIPGNTAKIKLISDESGNEWGFKVTKINGVPVEANDKEIVMKFNETQAFADGKISPTTQYANGYATLKNIDGTAMIPLRYIAEVSGFTVAYDEATMKTKVTNKATGEYLLITPESKSVEKFDKSGNPISKTDAPREFTIDNGVTMGPQRFVCEALGLTVFYKWFSDSEQYITVTTKSISAEESDALIAKAQSLGL